ncbi:MAG: membrane biogenesis protein [Candidatus Peribacteria bacterium]|jgi:predicted TIM-barrel enzyme|nr:membrane biogenesis protein [Candidatus Peribacteria bacterium]
MKKTDFLSIFSVKKPIIGMIHLWGSGREDILDRAELEVDIMLENGIDAVLVENYFGAVRDVENTLKWLGSHHPNALYGVNILSKNMPDLLAFELAREYGANFIQIDSVAGHLLTTPVDQDGRFAAELDGLRTTYQIPIIGGVRFKYQSVLSGRTEAEDLKVGMQRCDAIAVTGSGTGIETNLQKIKNFRSVIGDFPLVVAAGLTADNCQEQMAIADAGIVGSFLKDTYKDIGEVSESHVKELVEKIKTLRQQ